jgi:hypothetical protein
MGKFGPIPSRGGAQNGALEIWLRSATLFNMVHGHSFFYPDSGEGHTKPKQHFQRKEETS